MNGTERWATFDCFGTLIDWHTGFRKIFSRIAGARAVEFESVYHEFESQIESGEFRTYSEVTAQATQAAAAKLGIDMPLDDAGALARDWGSLPAFEDTRPALLDLRDAGWRIGILTNCDVAMFEKTKPELGVRLDLTVTAEEVRSYKPAFAHFTTFRERVKPASWVHVACSWYHDIAPARALDIARVWIDRDRTGDDPSAATLVLPSLGGLAATVERAARRHRQTGGNTI